MENQEILIPEDTKWNLIHNFLCLPISKIDGTNKYFIKYWEIMIPLPSFVIFLIIISIISYFFTIFNRLKDYKLFFTIEIFFFLILFLISYFSTMCSDPGYLPFNWIKTQKTKYDWQEILSGKAITTEQIEFAKKYKPNFASFSTFSGLYIIRADHICGWVANWIGKRNLKFFILQNLYGSIYCISLIIFRNFYINYNIKLSNYIYYLSIFSAIFEYLFAFILIMTFFGDLLMISENQTQISQFKNIKTENIGFYESMKEVFGEKNFFCWFCPIFPFNDELNINL